MRSGVIIVALLLFPILLYPQKVISASDKQTPHWVQRVDDILRYNLSYEYKVIESEGPNLQSLKDNRLIDFALFMQQTNKIDGVVERNTIGVNTNGNIDRNLKSAEKEKEDILTKEAEEKAALSEKVAKELAAGKGI